MLSKGPKMAHRLLLADDTTVVLDKTLEQCDLYSLSDPLTKECAYRISTAPLDRADRLCSRRSHGTCLHLWSRRTKTFLSECMKETAAHKRASIESALRKRHQNIYFTRVRKADWFK